MHLSEALAQPKLARTSAAKFNMRISIWLDFKARV
jgi:hypothetical protein